MELILASKSPRRIELLRKLTSQFSVIPSQFDESLLPLCEPEQYVLALAQAKALSVAARQTGAIVIGSDTVVVSPSNEIFGIPKDREDACRMLHALSGQVHHVITGVCVFSCISQKKETFFNDTAVTFLPLTPHDIDCYLDSGEWRDKAGGYGIQGAGALLIAYLQGDFYSVMGLPISQLNQTLKKFCEIGDS